MSRIQIHAMIQSILAAILFGASAPFAKLLVGKMEPIPLAALMYLGGGVGLLLLRVLRLLCGRAADAEARISKTDMPWLIGALLAGGVGAPIILMFSLRNTPAATASLLLNFEGVATVLIAAAIFKEAMGRRVWLATFCVSGASVLLSLDLSGEWGVSLGAIGVLVACALWGIDNNFTCNISAKDPVVIVIFKGIGAGLFSLALAFSFSTPMPSPLLILFAMLLGFFSYGLSIVLFILSMRSLGAGRTSALFGTAPFIGVVISFLVFQESPDLVFMVSFSIMVLGAVLLLREKHVHHHVHDVMEHEHRHYHEDGHHAHNHQEQNPPDNISHSHPHRHEEVAHEHAHTPDIHHRHK
jgi:drug/metabolite transporter (DMT)-like permease